MGPGRRRVVPGPARGAAPGARRGGAPRVRLGVRAPAGLLVHRRRQPRRRDPRLPAAHRQGAGHAQMGPGLLAEPRTLQHAGRTGGHAPRVPPPAHPRGQHRPGLAVLAGRPVGEPRVRPRPLSGPGEDAGRRARHARPLHDQRLAQVLHQYRALQGAEGSRLHLPAPRRGRRERLAEPPAELLRRLFRGRPQDVLAADGRNPV